MSLSPMAYRITVTVFCLIIITTDDTIILTKTTVVGISDITADQSNMVMCIVISSQKDVTVISGATMAVLETNRGDGTENRTVTTQEIVASTVEEGSVTVKTEEGSVDVNFQCNSPIRNSHWL